MLFSRPFMLCAVTEMRRASCAPEIPGSFASVFSTMAFTNDRSMPRARRAGLDVLAQGLHDLT